MENLIIPAHIAVSASGFWVWTVRHRQVIADFQKFRLSEQAFIHVGLTKMVLAFLLAFSVVAPVMRVPAALGMTFMMLAAQYYHEQFGSPLTRRLPSAILGLLCLYILISSF